MKDDAGDIEMQTEIEEAKRCGIDRTVLGAIRRAMQRMREAQNGLPDNERILKIADGLYWITLGLLRYMGQEHCPRGKLARFVFIIKPVAWPAAFVAVAAIVTGRLGEIVTAIKSLL